MEELIYDKDKAQHLFLHCIGASLKFSHRAMSKRELVDKLKKISQFSVDRSFRQHLIELEDRINDLVKKERRILTVTKREREDEKTIQSKIDALEEKLSKYIQQKAEHEIRIKELETKVSSRMKRKQAVHEIKVQIHALQDIYDEIVQTRYLYDPAKVRTVEQRLASLKKRLEEMEPSKE